MDNKSLDHLSAIISIGPIVVYTCEAFGEFAATSITSNITEQLGYEPDEFLNTPGFWASHIHPYDKPKIFEGLESLFEKSHHSHEYRFLHKDGNYRWMHDDLRLIVDDSGQPERIVGYWTDITERKQTEVTFRRSEELLQSIFDHSEQLIALLDKDFNFIKVNQAYAKADNREPSFFSGKNHFDLFPDEGNKATFCQVVETGEPHHEIAKPFEYVKNPERGVSHWDWVLTPLKDTEGRISMLTLMLLNVSDRINAIEELQESQARYRETVEGTEDLITIVDREGRFEFVNHAAHSIFGVAAEECVGLTAFDFIHPGDRERTIEAFNGWIENKETAIVHENRQVSRDGSVHHMSWKTFIRYDDDGEIITLNGIARDITERKRLEEQLRQSQKMEVVGQLAGGVAHDFNNLMGVMIGNAEELQQGIKHDEKARHNVEAIIKAVDRGAYLTQRLLSFSRQQTLSLRPSVIDELIVDLKDMLQRSLGETVELITSLRSGADEAIIDPHQLENALVNLAVNARDAMPNGGKLIIETANVSLDAAFAKQHKELTPGDYVEITVSDTGTGMAPEVLENVFDPFFTTKEVGAGSGLGLSMVYGFVKQSKGHVKIDSVVGRGTTVKLYLPKPKEILVKEKSENKAPDFALESENILVVEDDPDVREITTRILSVQGYQIVEAKDGKQAIQVLKSEQPVDLLFTDIVLPDGINGAEIAKQATRLRPNIKVLFTTGYAEGVVVHNGEIDPGVAVISKPYRRAELLEVVRAVLGNLDN